MDLDRGKFDELKARLEALGFTFEDRAHQLFLARGDGVIVNLYESGRVVLGGAAERFPPVMAILEELGVRVTERAVPVLPPLEFHGTRVGMDEVGKGDYFGPLVVCAALVTEPQATELLAMGVRDSKTLGDTTISNLAVKIRKILAPEQIRIVRIPPVRYNLLFDRMRNVNRVLGWAHATALEDVLAFLEPCELAIADQFGDESFIEDSLKRRGKKVRLIQTPRAERDIAVATASVLARDDLLRARLALREEYSEDFPLGASNVEEFAKRLVERLGTGALVATAKIHFATTGRVLGRGSNLAPQVRALAAQAEVRSEIGPVRVDTSRLEAYSLLDSFEPELRTFIREELERVYGGDWWVRGVPSEIRERAERRRRQEAEKGRDSDVMEHLEFSHYELVMHGDNWSTVFKPVFQDGNSLLARLRPIQDIRNPVAHTRAISPADRATLIGSIGWMRGRMTGFRQRLDAPAAKESG
jgi:ribonuclease HIII